MISIDDPAPSMPDPLPQPIEGVHPRAIISALTEGITLSEYKRRFSKAYVTTTTSALSALAAWRKGNILEDSPHILRFRYRPAPKSK